MEVGHGHLRGRIDKGVDLEIVGCLVSLVDLVRAKAVGLLLANELLVVNCLVILIIGS